MRILKRGISINLWQMLSLDSFYNFAIGMKKLKFITTILAVTISTLLSFDDSFSSCIDKDLTQIPFQSDCSGISHHHLVISDHYFYKNSVACPGVSPSLKFRLIPTVQFIADQYYCSIWEPPKETC